MRTIRHLFILLMALSGIIARSQGLPQWASDATGTALLELVKKNCHPTQHVSPVDLPLTACRLDAIDGTILNRFSLTTYPMENYSELGRLQVLPGSWMVMAGNSEKEFIDTDLHNLFPCDPEIINFLSNGYGPGYPEKVTFDNGVIKIGESGEGNIGRWAFPDTYKGELSRAFLYMVAVYPMTQWSALANNYLSPYEPLVIKSETLDYLMQCHSLAPPSQREIERNKAIEAIQGNTNPFITYPQLAELIWKSKSGGEGESPGGQVDPNFPDQGGVLKAVYEITDEWIWLNSKYIPYGSRWSIDGIDVDAERIAVSSLSKGKHLLEYVSSREKGKITIEVK